MSREAARNPEVRFASSLAGRLVLYGVLPGAILLATIIWLDARRTFGALERLAEQEIARETLYLAGRIEQSNAGAIATAESIATAQEKGLFGKRALTVGLLEGILSHDRNVTAAYVAYEPNADGNDATSATVDPKEWMEPGGRFIPYPFRNWENDDAVEVKPLVDYETSLYYDGVRVDIAETGRARSIVTEPYLYEGQLIVEQAHPIVIGGKFRGVGGADRALLSIERLVRERAAAAGAAAYLVSTRGRFVVATPDPEISKESIARIDEHLRTHPVADTYLAPLLEPLVRAADEDGVLEAGVDPVSGADLICVAARIPSGSWTLVLTKPRAEVIGPIRAEIVRGSLGAFGALALASGLVIFSARSVGRRLGQAAAAADAIARGDLATEVPSCSRRDEAGVLLRALGRMRANLNGLLRSVKTAGVTLDSGALELSATSREQLETSHRVGESSSQIAAASRQISATGGELARTVAEVEVAAGETAAAARGTRERLATVDGTIRELADATSSIAAKLAAISERAASINGVVVTIAKVAGQTNLLSVNAAIEAEKAGEQGRGFLVVAREIRRLADQTAAATLDIESIVREMQSAVGAGVMEMDRFAEKVRRGVDEVVASSREMGAIIEQVSANADRYRTVAEGTSSQSQGAATICESLSSLAAAAQRAVRTSEEFGRTAAELQRASAALRESVAAFTLRDA